MCITLAQKYYKDTLGKTICKHVPVSFMANKCCQMNELCNLILTDDPSPLEQHTDSPQGGYSKKNWVEVCGPIAKLNLHPICDQLKLCTIPYPIHDLNLTSKPCFRPVL